MVKQNQGFRRDLNLQENINDTLLLSNLGGSGIANDLRIIQNNLRNISSTEYISLFNGFFYFGDANLYIYTNDDVVSISTNVNVGSTTLVAGTDYYVCNSNAKNQFKLSLTPSSVGLTTINVTSVSSVNFSFIRKESVTQENILNYIPPQIQDTDNFGYSVGNINSYFTNVQTVNDTAEFLIDQKYKANEDTLTDKNLKFEGTSIINDPSSLNTSSIGLSDPKSPGIFIADTRAFSSDNNPWTQVGTSLSTSSSSVSIDELYFSDNITITGISTESATQVNPLSFTHKFPIAINGEIYYLLMLGKIVSYESLTYVTTSNLTITGNGSGSVNIFKTSGSSSWDNQAYSTTPFTAPCTIEFNKQSASGDNGQSYAMIGWNEDPTTNASYSSLDYASYPYRTDIYRVYHNNNLVQNGGTWDTANKFYIVYGTDGFIRHYNGSRLLYSVNYGTGRTVYLDSSFYSVNSIFGGFSNIRVTKSAWNGINYD